MAISFDLSATRHVAAAAAHYYEQATEPLYLDRVLTHHDLIYLCEGAWAITEGDTEYPLERDDVLLLTAGHHHYTRLPCKPGTRTFCIHISCESGDHEDNPRALSLPTRLSVRSAPEVRRYFEEIVSVYWGDKPHKEARLNALVNLLILALSDAEKTDEGDLAGRIIAMINAEPHRTLRVSEVAEAFHVSVRTIENAMNRSVGQSFSKYQMNRKLEMAARQIELEPDVRLAEIAVTLGFCDEFHLSKAFKRRYGVSPSQYRHTAQK
jgi:AraC-like DNA-binding protein